MKTVILYTNAFFLDSALEMANCIKTKVNLIFCIEITPYSKNATILNIGNLDSFGLIETPETVLNAEEQKKFKPYFEGMKSVYFIVHKNKKSFSLQTIYNSYKIARTINKHKADLWHFDNVSLRSIGFYPLIKKLVVHLHDPVAHSGEKNWRDLLKNRLYAHKANAFLFYSAYSETLFKTHFPKIKKPTSHISLQPYTFFTHFIDRETEASSNQILFFGRISPYKGIDILLEAIPKVIEDFPTAQFMIAGNPSYGCDIDESVLEKLSANLTYKKGYLDVKDMAKLIHNSLFVVCPYREATQSGVLFTAQAMGKAVVCTRVGAFVENIIDEKNGILCDPSVESVAEGIKKMLRNQHYLNLEKNIAKKSSPETVEKIGQTIDDMYQMILKS
jgi:glycosyltransferase involved in cell wall biosynthesis